MINYPLQITLTRGKMQNTLNITWFLLNVDNIIIIFYKITLQLYYYHTLLSTHDEIHYDEKAGTEFLFHPNSCIVQYKN